MGKTIEATITELETSGWRVVCGTGGWTAVYNTAAEAAKYVSEICAARAEIDGIAVCKITWTAHSRIGRAVARAIAKS